MVDNLDHNEHNNPSIEALSVHEVDPIQLLKLRDKVPGVKYYETSIDDFYNSLTKIYRSGNVSTLDGSVSVCIGGSFRSPMLNSELAWMGVKTAKKFSERLIDNGLAMSKLEEQIMKGVITQEGYIHPENFQDPIKTIFINFDLSTSEIINLYGFIRTIKKFHEKVGKPINLDVVVIPGDENDLSKRGKDFEDQILNRN